MGRSAMECRFLDSTWLPNSWTYSISHKNKPTPTRTHNTSHKNRLNTLLENCLKMMAAHGGTNIFVCVFLATDMFPMPQWMVQFIHIQAVLTALNLVIHESINKYINKQANKWSWEREFWKSHGVNMIIFNCILVCNWQ